MTRRSSKRKTGPREGGKATGRPKRDRSPDRGTPELQQKRQALVGEGGDATLSTKWLGVCCARGLVSNAELQAGHSFAQLRHKLYGTPNARASLLDRDDVRSGDGPTEKALVEAKRDYGAACRRLKSLSRQVFDEIIELCIYNRPPMILHDADKQRFPSGKALRQWARISAGLEVLAEVMATNQARKPARAA